MPESKSEILLISDLHLSAERPAMIKLFCRFIQTRGIHAQALYILGDFFEYWVGDDDPADELSDVFTAFELLQQNRIPVYFQHGNRDFLAAEKFSRRTGCQLINDPHQTEFFGTPVVLMHGDSLCTDDVKYQEFKKLVRGSEWQQHFLAKPLTERKEIVEGLRKTSIEATSSKQENIMDVNDNAVQQIFEKFRVQYLIHGHTHRPDIHTSHIDNQQCVRIVLGDWYDHGSLLSVRPDTRTGFIYTLENYA
jgi:UDP-2,3-diacylglucosamine hydrolase